MSKLIQRRELLIGAGALGVAAVPILAFAGRRAPPPVASSASLITGTTCPVTPEQTEGPFYFDPQMVRRSIAEGKPGVPLLLRLQVVDAAACAPSERARVDVWHCDAAGVYSGYDRERSSGQRWLRGTQLADENGVVTFDTIYPGWYEGRAPHVHVKAWVGGNELTSQLYFADALSDAVYVQGPYARSGRRQRNGDDFLFRGAGEHAPIAQATQRENGYEGAIVIAMQA